MGPRWEIEQVEAIAPSAAAVTAAQGLASPANWRAVGANERALWGAYQGSGAEPYETVVDHVHVGFACTCPSRKFPCKHALALLLLWVRGQVPETLAPARVESWIVRRGGPGHGSVGSGGAMAPQAGNESNSGSGTGLNNDSNSSPNPDPAPNPVDESPTDRDSARNDRVKRMEAGLTELDRWLDDRIRTGLSDPSLAQYSTWDLLAARLVDAQAGSLANRIRRLAGLVGASPDWHGDVLAELGMLHLLSQAGRHLGSLPSPLADAVATSVGWQVRQADVLAGVPDTDQWVVAGRSDTREDRIEVRRYWLRGASSGKWALVLSFAAYRQSLDTSLTVGSVIDVDLHRYPGNALRAIVGAYHAPHRHDATLGYDRPPAITVAEACDEIGQMLVGEPWLDRLPVTLRAALTWAGGQWVLTDDSGSLPVVEPERSLIDSGISTLLAVGGGAPLDVTVEWTRHGVLPLTIHLADRSIDIGPRADGSFVSAA